MLELMIHNFNYSVFSVQYFLSIVSLYCSFNLIVRVFKWVFLLWVFIYVFNELRHLFVLLTMNIVDIQEWIQTKFHNKSVIFILFVCFLHVFSVSKSCLLKFIANGRKRSFFRSILDNLEYLLKHVETHSRTESTPYKFYLIIFWSWSLLHSTSHSPTICIPQLVLLLR